MTAEIPSNRDGSFEPLLIGKYERRFTGFDDKISLDDLLQDTSTRLQDCAAWS